MQILKITLTVLLALLLQLLLPKHLRFFRFIELPLIVTVYFSLMRSPMMGMWTGALAGVGSDIIGGGIVGVGGFSKTLIGYVIATVSVKFPLDNPLARLGIVALASAANTIFVVGLYLMLEQSIQHVGAWGEFGATLGLKTLGDTLASIPIFWVLNRLFPDQSQAKRMAIRRRFYE
ncbi:MAG: rod shape-determining protein MreD [Acidobacteria bacterium]|nr:rod shape-determining protein MreD [Acidobacteriota bacterium]